MTTDSDKPAFFGDFWEASTLDPFSAPAFAAAVSQFSASPTSVHPFSQAGPEITLPWIRDGLQRRFEARRSERDFGERPLSFKQLAEVLSSVGIVRETGRRLVPAAGGFDAVHVYAFLRRVSGPADKTIVRYVHNQHRIGIVGEVPDDSELRRLFSLQSEGLPQLLLAFVVDPSETLAKYGERGGRFLVQEVGHAAQNVGLRLAESGLRGYMLGGLLDIEILRLLRLERTGALLVCGYACGQ